MLNVALNEVFREHRLDPVVMCIVGPNGSGKSSAAMKLGISDPGDGYGSDRISVDAETGAISLRFVNPDDFSLQIRELRPDLSQEQADPIAARLAEAKRRELAGARSDFGFETVGSHESKPGFLSELKESGYFVAILFVGTESPEINRARREARRRRRARRGPGKDRLPLRANDGDAARVRGRRGFHRHLRQQPGRVRGRAEAAREDWSRRRPGDDGALRGRRLDSQVSPRLGAAPPWRLVAVEATKQLLGHLLQAPMRYQVATAAPNDAAD